MKKKFLTALALLFSLSVLTGCKSPLPGANDSESKAAEEPTSSVPAEETSSKKHTHKWVQDESKTNKEATCSEEGIKYEKCECGETRESKIAKKDHTWGEWAAKDGAVCGQKGQEERECSVCHTKETRSGSMIAHAWVVQSTVDADADGIAYNFVKCSKCQKEGLMVATKKADGTNNMDITGSPKTAPEGCVKLGANGDTMTATIKLAEAKAGKLYIRGSMDYWYTDSNQNEQKGIFNGKSGGAANKDNNKANFTMEVGQDAASLTEVEITSDKDLLYKDWLPEEVGFENVSGTNWSQIGDIEVGDVSLAAGVNLIKFTRTDSYNIAVHDFVVVFNA